MLTSPPEAAQPATPPGGLSFVSVAVPCRSGVAVLMRRRSQSPHTYIVTGLRRTIRVIYTLLASLSSLFLNLDNIAMTHHTWLITGCTSGLGEAFVRAIIPRGDRAVATTRGDVARISALADVGAKTYSLDVTLPTTKIQAIIDSIFSENDIDVLINNAGYIEAGLCEETSLESCKHSLKPTSSASLKSHRLCCLTSARSGMAPSSSLVQLVA